MCNTNKESVKNLNCQLLQIIEVYFVLLVKGDGPLENSTCQQYRSDISATIQ